MFNLTALIKLINTNNDGTIQHQEMNDFMKSQDNSEPSIFSDFFNSIKSDVSVEQFKYGIQGVVQQQHDKGIYEFDLSFKQEEVAQKYEQIKTEMEMQQNLYSFFGYKFKSDDEFNAAFSELLSKYRDSGDEAWEKIENGLMERCASTTPADWMARLNTGRFYTSGTDFQNIVFEDVDLSKYGEAFKHITFNENTFAKVSPEHLPSGFNPQEVLEKGKTIGLGIDQAHANGYTGEGVSYAVIDSGTICNDGKQHSGLKHKEYYCPKSATYVRGNHGLATSYIAQEITPKADCYYYVDCDGNTLVDNLQAIIKKNETLPDSKKIRVISMSFSLGGDREKAIPLIKKLESQGVWVLSSDEQFWDNGFGYLEKINPNGEINDFNNYQIYYTNGKNPRNENIIFVSSGDRTVPDMTNSSAYRHDGNACTSWAIPVVAGYYTLACQADPSMTPKRFMNLARGTAQTITSTVPDWENDIMVSRSEDAVEIKVIDINALLQAIENEKVQRAE